MKQLSSVVDLPLGDGYVAPDSLLYRMLTAWHGWWRFFWQWDSKRPRFKVDWPSRHTGDPECGKWYCMVCIWKLTVLFNCESIKATRADYLEMFAEDIWPMVVLDDILDAEEIDG